MRNPLRRRSTVADLEAELARLVERKADAERRRSETLQAREEARAKRVDALGDDEGVVEKANSEVRRLTAAAEELEGIIEDFGVAIEASEQRVRDARDNEARKKSAESLETIAGKVDAISADLERDVAAMAKTFGRLLAAVPSDLGVFSAQYLHRPERRVEGRADMASAREAVLGVLADAIAAAIPGAFDQSWTQRGYSASLHRIVDAKSEQPDYEAREWQEPLPARMAAQALLSDRFRTLARQIREGEVSADLPTFKVAYKYQRPEPLPEMEIYSKVLFSYWVDGGTAPFKEVVGEHRTKWVPIPIGKAAIAAGYALRADDPQVAVIERKRVERHNSPGYDVHIGGRMPKELPDVLGIKAKNEEAIARLHSPSQEETEEAARAVG